MITDLEMVPDLESLRAKAEQVEDLVTPPLSEDERAKAGLGQRAERRLAWYRGVEDAILDLSNAMPEGVEDYDVRKLLESMVELRRLLEEDPEAQDPAGEVELVTMQTADIVRRIRRRLLHQRLDDPRIAVDFILGTLRGIPVTELAALLGVSTKTVSAWRQGGAVRQRTARVVLIAQVLAHLRGSMTPRGMLMWFAAERDQLDGRSPRELLDLDQAAAYPALTGLARGGRGQLAT
jgi:transcriptional regulator with XRE-family HTH domain